MTRWKQVDEIRYTAMGEPGTEDGDPDADLEGRL